MLRDYFSLDISDDGNLHTIPILLKGYMPSLGKLPAFLLRLGPNVSRAPQRSSFPFPRISLPTAPSIFS